jgi:hypothetical protein
MRVSLPDRPGSLGAVASALGRVGGDINAVEIVEKSAGQVVDDFIVDLPPGQLPETIVTACHKLEGVRVEWISRYPEGGGLQSDLEALERMTADPLHAAETLVSLCPVVFRSHWATLLDVSADVGVMTFSTPLAPDLDADLIKRFVPFDVAHRIDLETGWIPGWGESTVVVTPLKSYRAIAIGRLGGPPFMDSEIARLNHLAALVP